MSETAAEPISDNLFVYRDTCNVYVVRKGRDCLLVDSGSGSILGELPGIGMRRVEWVLHTHHHRDQCQGDHLLSRKTRIAVPFHERPLFEAAENFWRNKQIYDSYNDQSTYFALTRSIRVDASLVDYETFTWRGYSFHILPAPGHTHGSVCLLGEVDGTKVAFTGDMIHSPGKVWSLTELQHSYGGVEGVDLNAFSLRDLARQRPDLLLPSHGEPMRNADAAIRKTIDNLREYHRYVSFQPLTIDKPLKQVLPHLLVAPHACCTFYALLSKSGRAMLIDYGAASGNHFYAHLRQFESWEFQRFVEHSIHELRENWGVKSVDVVIPTHYHDDHTCGIPHLQKRHGVQLWALDRMVDILENPHRYNVPCLLPYAMKVDRPIADGEMVQWEEYRLTVVHFPGQTEYHMAMGVDIDGKRVVFVGDSIHDMGKALTQPIIHRNLVTAESHAKCAQRLVELKPDFLAHGHGGWFAVDDAKVRTLVDRAAGTNMMFDSILPPPSVIGVSPGWLRLVPYQSSVEAGGRVELALEMRNHFGRRVALEARPITPRGWSSRPEVGLAEIDEDQVGRVPFSIAVGRKKDRYALAADVRLDSRLLGQIVEAIVTVT